MFLNLFIYFLIKSSSSSDSDSACETEPKTPRTNLEASELVNSSSPHEITQIFSPPASPLNKLTNEKTNNNDQQPKRNQLKTPTHRQIKRSSYKFKLKQQKEQKNPQANRKKKERHSNDTSLDKLKCFYTNATSLNTDKLQELSIYVANEDPHCIFITETWFTDISVPQLDNYSLHRDDRNGHGGGTAIYTRKDLNVAEINDVKLKKKSPTSTLNKFG